MISLNCDYLGDALSLSPKTILIQLLGTISDPYTPSDHHVQWLVSQIQLKLDYTNVYGHLTCDITQLRLLGWCVGFISKNYFDSASRHHFWPIYTFGSSCTMISFIDTAKTRLHKRLWAFNVWYHSIAIIRVMRWVYLQKRFWFSF